MRCVSAVLYTCLYRLERLEFIHYELDSLFFREPQIVLGHDRKTFFVVDAIDEEIRLSNEVPHNTHTWRLFLVIKSIIR